MLDYEKLYRIIFNGMTDAIDCMEQGGYTQAKQKLIEAQQAAEEYYISGEDDLPLRAQPEGSAAQEGGQNVYLYRIL